MLCSPADRAGYHGRNFLFYLWQLGIPYAYCIPEIIAKKPFYFFSILLHKCIAELFKCLSVICSCIAEPFADFFDEKVFFSRFGIDKRTLPRRSHPAWSGNGGKEYTPQVCDAFVNFIVGQLLGYFFFNVFACYQALNLILGLDIGLVNEASDQSISA